MTIQDVKKNFEISRHRVVDIYDIIKTKVYRCGRKLRSECYEKYGRHGKYSDL